MEKLVIGKYISQLWCVVLISFFLCLLLLSFDYSHLVGHEKEVLLLGSNHNNSIYASKLNSSHYVSESHNSTVSNIEDGQAKSTAVNVVADQSTSTNDRDENDKSAKKKFSSDSCHGRYVYIHDLPSRFNLDLLKNCRFLNRGTDSSMCTYLVNSGLGPVIDNSENVLMNRSWYVTNQFMLEVIFHNRMKKYECLTNDSSMASAIYVPFYAGLDINRFLWGYNISVRDSSGLDLVKWLEGKPEWKKIWGRDHFMVAGRISWDFRRQSDNESDWGSKFMFLPQSKNMTMLSIESSVWRNDYAIPYPTYFHPSKESEIVKLQNKLRRRKRHYLFTFAGAPRPDMKYTLRSEIIDQCLASRRACRFLNCNSEFKYCDNPISLMKVLQSSTFCLQPRGDSYTRRSIFDSILAGCIPVFFHPGTAYVQYIWHLPRNYANYSVYIPVTEITDKKASIAKILRRFSKDEVLAMREEVIRTIPRILYADPRSRLDTVEDAFDIAVKGILKRIERVKNVIKEERDPSIGFAEENSFKFEFPVQWENLE